MIGPTLRHPASQGEEEEEEEEGRNIGRTSYLSVPHHIGVGVVPDVPLNRRRGEEGEWSVITPTMGRCIVLLEASTL